MSKPAEKASGRLSLMRWLRKSRQIVILGIGLITLIISQLDYFNYFVPVLRLEGQAHDLRFRVRGIRIPHPDIVLVGIDSSSFNQTQLRRDAEESDVVALMSENTWPWPRIIHAKVIERLFEVGAKTVAIDIVFASEREGDDALAAVIEKYKDRIVLASVVQDGQEASKLFLRPYARLIAGAGEGVVGYARVKPDPIDGIVRRFDFKTSELREAGIPDDTQDLINFASLAVARHTGGQPHAGYNQALNYYGPKTRFAHLPVEEIFLKRTFNQGRTFEGGKIFKDKLVFYGPLAEVLHDNHNTPYGDVPGVEIHANLASSILQGQLIKDASQGVGFLSCLLVTLSAALSVMFIRHAVLQGGMILLVGALFCGLSQLAFSKSLILIPSIPSLFCIISTGLLTMLYLFFLEQWEKKLVRKVLNRSVSKRIATVILKNAEEFEHASMGEKRPVAVFFSDIRGFTTWTEEAEPEHLVGQLKEYFERMVTLIEQSEGNVQKFIGDAILAAWGDTHSNGHDVDVHSAVSTVLKIRPALRELNEGWKGREDRREINIGMGVNHGEVVVGLVGAFERNEYTVLGDGVNFAARLESATKQFHTDCLVGQSVEEQTRDKFVFRRVDYLIVKGKKLPVHVFSPLSDSSTPPPEWLADYHRAIEQLYWKQQFSEATTLFQNVKGRIGDEDFLCDMYIRLCEKFIATPPPPDWDGSRELTEK